MPAKKKEISKRGEYGYAVEGDEDLGEFDTVQDTLESAASENEFEAGTTIVVFKRVGKFVMKREFVEKK